MKRLLVSGLAPALAVALIAGNLSQAADKSGPQLAHVVYFTLKDHSTEAREQLVASCQKYLNGHEGAVWFSVGTIAEDVDEPPVSVRDFDVAINVVFRDKAAKEAYLVNPRHKEFVAKNKDVWSKVRVFDSYLVSSSK
ncbi:MAG: Dabb family protein [Isosphaeraceae bacterium]